MWTKFLSTHINIEINRSFGTYLNAKKFQARSFCALAHIDFLDVQMYDKILTSDIQVIFMTVA